MEEYLPVYLWTIHHKKQSNNLFWEILSLLPNGLKRTESPTVDEVVVPIVTEGEVLPTVTAPREKLPCLYCGGEFGGLGGLKRHLHYCRLNVHGTKKIKLASPVEDVPVEDSDDSCESDIEEYPCLYCDSIFTCQELLTRHLVSCNANSFLSK